MTLDDKTLPELIFSPVSANSKLCNAEVNNIDIIACSERSHFDVDFLMMKYSQEFMGCREAFHAQRLHHDYVYYLIFAVLCLLH